MTVIDELITQYKNEESKYVYYVLALSVAAIGFSATVSMDMKLHWKMIPLGGSVLFWCTSVFYGLNLLGWRNVSTYANISLLQIIEGSHDFVKNQPENIQLAIDTLKKNIERNQNIIHNHARIQNSGFFAGIMFFIFWRIIMMW